MLQFPWLLGVDLSFVSQSVWDTLRSPWAAGDMTYTKDRPCLLLPVKRRMGGSLILSQLFSRSLWRAVKFISLTKLAYTFSNKKLLKTIYSVVRAVTSSCIYMPELWQSLISPFQNCLMEITQTSFHQQKTECVCLSFWKCVVPKKASIVFAPPACRDMCCVLWDRLQTFELVNFLFMSRQE